MLEEQLIEEVGRCKHLYDRSLLIYSNRVKRKLAWEKISIKLNTTVRICQTRWRILRDRFVKEYTRSQKVGEKDYNEHMKWKHFDRMKFLLGHLKLQIAQKAKNYLIETNTPIPFDPVKEEEQEEVASEEEIKFSEPSFNKNLMGSNEIDIRLVREVQKHPSLYDRNSEDYHEDRARAVSWADIAKRLKCPTHIVKTRWRMLRDRFVRIYNKKQSLKVCNTKEKSSMPPDALYDEMLFLENFISTNIIVNTEETAQESSIEEDTFEEDALLVPKLFTLHLINEVSKYECLYSNNIGCKNKRISAWTRISSKLKTPAIILQKKWRNLRDRFVKEYAKNPNSSKWSFFEDLKFLKDYIVKKKKDKSLNLDEKDPETLEFEEEAVLMDVSCVTNQGKRNSVHSAFDIDLINEVKQFEEIYVPSNIYYRHTLRLKVIWQKIAKQLNTTAKRCRFRWSYLRDRFVKEQVRYEKFGKVDEYHWDLYEDLLFLKDHIRNRRKILFNDISDEEEENSTAEDEPPCKSLEKKYPQHANFWERINCKKLIEEVKKRPMLYKIEYSTFRYRNERAVGWREISEVMGFATQHCIIKWRGLRKRYIRESQKMQELETVGEEPVSDWPYLNQMDFISEHHTTKKHNTKDISKNSSNEYKIENMDCDNPDEFEELSDQELEEVIDVLFVKDNSESEELLMEKNAEALPESTINHTEYNPNEIQEEYIIADSSLPQSNNNLEHIEFLKKVSSGLSKISYVKQEDAKIFFLNYLHEKTKKYIN